MEVGMKQVWERAGGRKRVRLLSGKWIKVYGRWNGCE